jgi:glucose-1-phosphate adenylyltransferase
MGALSSRHPSRIMDAISLQNKTLAIVMGGGAGTRLFPLTKDRAKPAVPLAGKYRLVDIPISNCLNSGFRQVYVLTQFNSMSLHRHINASYKFDNFSRNFVEILAAQQTTEGARWYQGTADAVRQNLRYFLEDPYEYYLILSGDQLYRMDYSILMQQHVESGAAITLATTPVDRTAASAFGIMHSDADRRIVRFEEKPKDPKLLDELRIPAELLKTLDLPTDSDLFQGSMGIYVFNRDVLIKCLAGDQDDFGKHIIPGALNQYKVMVYIFKGYWEDIGTIRAFFEANLALTDTLPPYNFFDRLAPIYTHPRFLPASKINAATLRHAIIADGCIISDAHIDRAIIGVRSIIESGATIRNSVIMGADFYEELAERPDRNVPPIGIGRNSVVDRAIIDKNARIGENVVITPDGKAPNVDSENYYIRDGVVVIPKNAVLADGSWI